MRKKALLVFSFEIRCSQLFYDRLIVFSGYCIFIGMEQYTYEIFLEVELGMLRLEKACVFTDKIQVTSGIHDIPQESIA